MKARFILVRHGQTEWNRKERFRGLIDIPLNEVGLMQAEAAARHLEGEPVVAAYSSPLKRTLQTADAIVKRFPGMEVRSHDGLLDLNFGDWQGLSIEEAREQDGELYRKWIEEPERVRFPNGESLHDVRARVTAAVDELTGKYPDQTVLLVSHRVVCKVLICAILGLDDSHFWQVGQDECAINVFYVGFDMPQVSLINDTCHLKTT